MIVKFGIWEVTEDYGIIGKVNPRYDYNIPIGRLWETTDYEGRTVWNWLIHLTEKTWIDSTNVNDLNTAFWFAQDYFKSQRPDNVEEVSTAQTIYIQRQLIEIGERESARETSTDGITIDLPTFDQMQEYIHSLQNIQLLDR